MRFISLFAGIGGFDLGFDRAGMTCQLQVENDENALSVLNKHWPDVPKMEDVRDVTRENSPTTDLICGGFPCQDVSVAGRREGLAGERSGLWFEFRRIIAEINPQWVVIENVPGLLSSNGGRDMGAIVGALAKLRYWWAYRVLDAQFFGVPQRRRRVFIVASLTRGCPQEVLFEPESSPWDTPPRREEGAELAKDFTGAIRSGGKGGKPSAREGGNGLVCSFSAGNSGDSYGVAYSENITPPLRASNSGTNQTPTVCFVQNTRDEVRLMNGDGKIAGALSTQPGMKQQNYIAATVQSGSNTGGFRTEPGEHIVNQSNGVRRLTPLEAERLQGFPDNWTNGQSDSVRYRQLGNAVAVPAAEWLGKQIMRVKR